LSVNSTP